MDKKDLILERLKSRIDYVCRLARDMSLKNEILLLLDEYQVELKKSNEVNKKCQKKKQTS